MKNIIRFKALALIGLAISTAAAAQTPRLTRLTLTPTEATAGSIITVMVQFNRPGQAMPILTSSNPRVFNPGGNWRTNGAPTITRNLRYGTTPGCTTVKAIWGRTTREQEVCVRQPEPRLCASFTVRSPANSATQQSRRVRFDWNRCSNASSYRVMMRNGSSTAQQIGGTTPGTSATMDVPASFGNSPDWFVEASRGNQRRNSSNAHRIRFQQPPPPPPPPTSTRLTWDDPITLQNFPGLQSWPATFRQRVEGQHSLKSIAESRVVVRNDNFVCSSCHYQDGGSRKYMPPTGQSSRNGNINSNTTIPQCTTGGCQQNGTWQNFFAQRFLGNTPGTSPSSGVKPDYLRALVQQWVTDGRRP